MRFAPDEAMDMDEIAEEGEEGPQRRRGKRNLRAAEDIPRVRDETGERVREAFEQFVKTFSEDGEAMDEMGDASPPKLYYMDQIKSMRPLDLCTLYVDFSHLLNREPVLAQAIQAQYYRFLPYLRIALQELIKEYDPAYLYTNAHSTTTAAAGLMMREFHVAFYNLKMVSGIRELRTERIGQLVSISGAVTRTSEVRPELIYGSFVCQECHTIVRDVEQQFKYTEPNVCPNINCGNRAAWRLNIEQSKFADWQKVRIQENANEIPTGSMPRSLDVILRAEVVERAKAGDKAVFTGTFIVVPDVSQLGLPGVNTEMMREAAGGRSNAGGVGNFGVTGLKALGVRDLTYKTAFLACMVQSADARAQSARDTEVDDAADAGERSREEFLDTLTNQEIEELKAMVNQDHIYSRLVNSVAPTVYGHEIVKKGILLQLMGGVHKRTQEGIHLRGDLNICVVGDPSTSKSQFLKWVCGFLPRAVYTSGKASSAAGLTAAVVKDEETGEFTIEAGALMLADNGICAIDEFDKMDLSDQVAIHEAMEQQTISIAKAGIQATLNARTSILAAANPVGGRYNRRLGLRANVAMTAPIMSRFDLFFVVLDECNEQTDLAIAQHIVDVHRYRDAAINPEFSTDLLQRYIRYARTFNPKLTPEASAVLVEKYRLLRQDDAAGQGARSSYRITVRQLESLIRLSEAIARANCTAIITPSMVKEAFSLLSQSLIRVEQEDVGLDDDDKDDGDDAPRPDDNGDAMEEDAAPTSQGPSSPTRAAPPKRQKMTITYERYQAASQLILLRLADAERSTGAGLPRSQLIEFYLESNEDQIDSEAQLEQERELIGKILNKLVKERQLLELRGDGLQDDGAQADADEDPVVLLHPDSNVDM